MTDLEIQEYHRLADKRDFGKLTNKEYKRWLYLVDKSFIEGIPKVAKAWMEGFKI